MALIVDGVEIPEVNGVINVDGTAIETVVVDGTTIWERFDFSAQWSGNSTIPAGAGIETSGSNFRFTDNFGSKGAWIEAYTNGTFENQISAVGSGVKYGFAAGGYGPTASNEIVFIDADVYADTNISFDPKAGFSGSSLINGAGLEAIDGMLRYKTSNDSGALVTLT